MNSLEKWIEENSKDGADIAKAKELIKDLDPLKNITTSDEALAFMERNSVFRSAIDAETSRRSEKAIETWKGKNLDKLMKEKEEQVRLELNPEEDPRDKTIREMQEKMKQRDIKDAQTELKAKLRAKASDIGFDPIKAERYYIYGDDAEKMLVEDSEYFSTTLNEKLEKEIKTRFAGQTPKGSPAPEKLINRTDFNDMSQTEQRDYIKSGGKITD